MKTLAEIKMSPEEYSSGVKLSGKRATDLLKHSWAQHDVSTEKQKAGDKEGAETALKASGRAHKLYLKAKERHLKNPANAEAYAHALMSGASDYYKSKKPGQYVGDSVEMQHDGEQIDELSKSTIGSYVKKAAMHAAVDRKIGGDFEHRAKRAKTADMKDASTRLADEYRSKAFKRQDNINKAVDRLVKEENIEENNMTKLHPNALHVKPVKVNGQTRYKVHAVGSNLSDGIRVGEHLTDTNLDDATEMGAKIKHIREQKLLKDIIDEARGRPRKNPVAAPKKSSEEDDGEDYGPDTGPEADQHIQNQLKRAHDAKDLKGGADVKFENGKKHFIKSEHAHKVLTALEKLKPADRAEAAAHVYKSHENFQAVHSMLK